MDDEIKNNFNQSNENNTINNTNNSITTNNTNSNINPYINSNSITNSTTDVNNNLNNNVNNSSTIMNNQMSSNINNEISNNNSNNYDLNNMRNMSNNTTNNNSNVNNPSSNFENNSIVNNTNINHPVNTNISTNTNTNTNINVNGTNQNNIGIENNPNINANVNTNYNAETQIKPKKEKKKKKHRFLKFLLIVILIIAGIKGFKIVKEKYREKQFDKLVKEIPVLQNEDIQLTEEELQEDSNSDGMTNGEKIKLGLDILSDDTDGDGLTDYDEINVYHSDPKKYSTSGDVLGDGYKIEHGYDINGNYGQSTIITTENENIKLAIDNAKDLEAVYKEYTGNIPSGYTLGMQPFRIYSYEGQAEVKIENPEYYEVISYDNLNKEETKIDSEVNGEFITFNISNDDPIMIAVKNKLLQNVASSIQAKINIKNNEDSEYIIVAMPIFNKWFGLPVYIYQVNNTPNKNNTKNTALETKLNNQAQDNIKYEVKYVNSFWAKFLDFFFGSIEKEFKNQLETNDSESLLQWIFVYKHVKSGTELENYLFSEDESNEEIVAEEADNSQNEEINGEEQDESQNKYENTKGNYYADSGFSVTRNAFKFSNLTTTVSEGGNCMGFAHITTNMYNGGNLPKFAHQNAARVYDLSDSAYNTIWNAQLYNYKPTSPELITFADDIRGNQPILNSVEMEKPDAEVVKMIEYYFVTINSKMRLKKASWAWNYANEKQTYIKAETIDNLVSEFRNGKIVSVVLLSNNQHAINAYKITEDQNDQDILYLKAYDNNCPADMFWTGEGNAKQKYDITIKLKRCYKKNKKGETETYYLYDYNPLNREDYHYGNMNGGTDSILFFDENMKVF